MKSLRSSLSAAGRRAALALLLLQFAGCAFFRPATPPPIKLPAGFMDSPQAAALANPRQAAFKALFPFAELTSIQSGGSLVISSRWQQGKEPFEFYYYSRNDADKTEHMVRLRGFRGPVSLFDMVVRGHDGLVVFYEAMGKAVFQGELPKQPTPIGNLVGIELWELAPVFTIGQRIAVSEFTEKKYENRTVLRPLDRRAAAGLRRVILEKRSGLPCAAQWVMSGKTYEIQYLAWDFFTDPLSGKTGMMPSAIQIRRLGVLIDMNLTSYQYNKQPSDRLFNISVEDLLQKGYPSFPLEQLEKIK